MSLPPVQPRTRLAHEAAHWARTTGHFEGFHEWIFRAFFERGENIGNIGVLVPLALELGLDGPSLRVALERHELEKSVLVDEQEADRLGIEGVPAFVAERKAAQSGVQPAENLRQLVSQSEVLRNG